MAYSKYTIPNNSGGFYASQEKYKVVNDDILNRANDIISLRSSKTEEESQEPEVSSSESGGWEWLNTQTNTTDNSIATTQTAVDKSKPRSVRNNNPGNIRHSKDKFIGEVDSQDAAFKSFKDNAHGFRAMFKTYQTYVNKHGVKTVQDLINRWAPTSDNNNPVGYAKRVAELSGINPSDIIDITNKDQMTKLANAMAVVESGGVQPDAKDIESGWGLFASI